MTRDERLVISGGPKTGKSTLTDKVIADADTRPRWMRTDDFMDLGWSEASQAVADWMTVNSDGPWIVEGVAAVRALRKMIDADPDVKPCDRLVILRHHFDPLTTGQESMTKGLFTVLSEITDRLTELGVTITIYEEPIEPGDLA